jgi:hypothetical protein
VLVSGVVLAIVTVVVALHPEAVRADQPGWSVVEASQFFCVNPAQPCEGSTGEGNLGFEEVAAVNFFGQAFATPSAAVFVCARGYTASDGDAHVLSGHAFPGYDGASSTAR